MKRTLTVILIVLILLNLAFIFYNSHKTAEQSFSESTEISKIVLNTDDSDYKSRATMNKFNVKLRDFSHSAEFFPIGLFTVLLCFLHSDKIKKLLCPLISFASVLLFALGDETHQIFVPGRAFQTEDIFLDCIGGVAGILLGTAVSLIIIKRIKSRQSE